MDRSLENFNLPRLNQEEIEIMNYRNIRTEIKAMIKNLPKNKSPGRDGFTGEFYQSFREELMPAAAAAAAKSLQSCPTLCDPRDGSPSGSPVPGILQARTLEWVAISFSNV